MQAVIDGTHALIADILIIGIHRGADVLDVLLLDGFKQIVVDLLRLESELGLADLRLHFLDESDHLLYLGKALHDGFQHGVIVHLVGTGFDHADLFGSTGNGKL